jgi:esterase/lipase
VKLYSPCLDCSLKEVKQSLKDLSERKELMVMGLSIGGKLLWL